MFCRNCGNEVKDGTKFCPHCGCPTNIREDNSQINSQNQSISSVVTQKNKCLPAFILGLIGGIFGILGGFCTTMCLSFAYSNNSGTAFFLIFCGSIIGLVGACLCLNKAFIGSIVQLIAALMIIICAYGISGSEFMTVLAMLLFLAGGIIGIIFSIINLKKK